MFVTAIIAFREFLEAFLLVGLFIGINRKFHLQRQKEIFFATASGIFLSLILPIIVFFLASDIKAVLTEKSTDIIEGYFLTFSGFFLAYVVFSLHAFMKNFRDRTIAGVHKKMESQIFDFSLFFTIIFFIAREGFEISLLVATTSIFSVFWSNMTGLLLGFVFASLVGLFTTFTYIRLPIRKVFLYTEYLIMIIGAAMVMNGVSILLQNYINIRLANYLPLPLQFLPSDQTVAGHLLKNLFGIQKSFSLLQVFIMISYIVGIYYFLILKNHVVKSENKKLNNL